MFSRERGTPMRCDRCGFEWDDDDERFCSRCGAEQMPGNASAARPRFCSSCGSPIEPGMRFCSACGSPVGAEPQASQAAQPDSSAPAALAAQSVQAVPPAATVPPAQAVPSAPSDQYAPAAQSPSSGRKSGHKKTLIIAIVAVIAIVAGLVAWNFLAHTNDETPARNDHVVARQNRQIQNK